MYRPNSGEPQTGRHRTTGREKGAKAAVFVGSQLRKSSRSVRASGPPHTHSARATATPTAELRPPELTARRFSSRTQVASELRQPSLVAPTWCQRGTTHIDKAWAAVGDLQILANESVRQRSAFRLKIVQFEKHGAKPTGENLSAPYRSPARALKKRRKSSQPVFQSKSSVQFCSLCPVTGF